MFKNGDGKEISNSERFLNYRRGAVPQAPSNIGSKSISPQRRAEMESQIERGEFQEGFLPKKDNNKTFFSNVGIVKGKIAKTASDGFGGGSGIGGTSWRGDGGVVRQGPEIYNPLYLTSNTHLPRDRGTMNAWVRAYFATNAIVNNACNLHSTYPIAKLNVSCPDKRVETFFADMIDEMDLLNVCVQIAQEFFVIGECFPYLILDENTLRWSKCVIQNPDYIYVKRTAVVGEPEISLKPDSELRRIVLRNDPECVKLRKELPQEIIKYVKSGQNIPLDNFYISHLARKISPYETRGTSLIAPCFKALMLWDKLRECKYAQADNMINPITLIKLGGSADADYKPTEDDIRYWTGIFEEAQYDKDFKIIAPGSITIERIGAQAVIDINTDLQNLAKEIYIGLMVPQVIMEAGDITYANGSLSLDVLRQRYMQFQNMMSKWIRTKVFAPIAQLNDFWEYKDGQKKLIIPNVEWNHMSLFDLTDYIQQLSQLVGERKLVSVHTLYRSLGLDYESEQSLIRQEQIAEAIHKREAEILSKLSLTELKALGNDDEIPDIPDHPVPGESPDEKPVGGQEEGGAPPMGGLGGPPGGGAPGK